MKTFEEFLIMVGIRSAEFNYDDDLIFSNIEHFRTSFENNLSAYKALLFLYDPGNSTFKKKFQ